MQTDNYTRHYASHKQNSPLQKLLIPVAAAIGISASAGCTSIPSSDDRNLSTHRAHFIAGQSDSDYVENAHDAIVCSQIGAYRKADGSYVVVSAQLGLDDSANLEGRLSPNGGWQPRAGDIEWEFAVEGQSPTFRSTWYVRDAANQRQPVVEQVWTDPASDRSTITLYNAASAIVETEYQRDDVSRAELQQRFFNAIGNANLRNTAGGSHHTANVAARIGLFAYDHTIGGALQSLPLLELAQTDAPNPLAYGEQSNAGGVAGFYGRDSMFWGPTSAVGNAASLPFQGLINLIRDWEPGIESRRALGTLTAGDYGRLILLSIVEPLVRRIQGATSIDEKIFGLIRDAWPTGYRVGNERTHDAYWGDVAEITKQVALAVIDASGSGSSSGIPGIPGGAGANGGEFRSDGVTNAR